MAALRKLARAVACEALFRTGVVASARARTQDQAKILIYHSVAPQESPYVCGLEVTVSPSLFEKQLDYLCNNYHIVTLQQLVSGLRQARLSKRTIVLTFDDGFRDNYELAWPILRKYGVSATIFLCTDVIGTGKVLWPHRLTYLMNCVGVERVLELAEGNWSVPDGISRSLTYLVIINLIARYVQMTDIETFLQGAFRHFGIVDPDRASAQLYLGWAQVEEMMKAGIEFGNHTCSHSNLALLDQQGQRQEIIAARDRIIGAVPENLSISFAYPFGQVNHFTDLSEQIVQESGHSCALQGVSSPIVHGSSVYSLGRIYVAAESLAQFACRIEGISPGRMLRSLGRAQE